MFLFQTAAAVAASAAAAVAAVVPPYTRALEYRRDVPGITDRQTGEPLLVSLCCCVNCIWNLLIMELLICAYNLKYI